MNETIIQWWNAVNAETAIATAIAVLIVLIPVSIALFRLISSNDRKALALEKEAHEKTNFERQEFADEVHRMQDRETELLARLAVYEKQWAQKKDWKNQTLNDAEQYVLVAFAQDKLSVIRESKKYSSQRIDLAKNTLSEKGFLKSGTMGLHISADGRKWLDENRLLD